MKPGPRERKRSEQRERILDGARKLFAARGFDEVTVAEVALAAGVARATVFNYFPSKHALVDAITEGVLGYWLGMLERAEADERSPTPVLLRALFGHMGEGIERVRELHRGVFREIARVQLGLDEGGAVGRSRELAAGRLAALMRRGQARGEISPAHDALDLARAFDALATGTILHWLYDDASVPLRERMTRASAIFLERVSLLSGDAARVAPLPDLSPDSPVAPDLHAGEIAYSRWTSPHRDPENA